MAVNDGWCNNKSTSWGGRKKSTGPNPTDIRSKSGTKRSLLVEGQGIPIGITIDGGANRHDMKMTKEQHFRV